MFVMNSYPKTYTDLSAGSVNWESIGVVKTLFF